MKRLLSPLMVGRAGEMAVLGDAFAEACGGAVRTVVISAEGGGGKTRLIREATAGFGRDAQVLAGWCVEQGDPGLPFAPFVSVVRQLVQVRGVAGLVTLVGHEAVRELAHLVPTLGPVLAEGDPGMARSRLFESLRLLLERLAAEAPVVLVLEDLHWADRVTRDLLLYLARNLIGIRLLMLASYRTEALASTHPLRAGLGELARIDGVSTLVLPRLSRADVALHLAAMLGHEPEPGVVNAVHARGAGVPLFTEALLAPDGSVRERLAGSWRDLLLGAVNELPGRALEVLRAMAVGGPRVGHRLLCAVAGADGMEAALRTVVASNIVVVDDDGGHAFRHALIHEAVRDDLLPGERQRLHRDYAQALEADPSLDDGTWVAASIALHWRAADDPTRALAAAWRAAREATTRLAYAEQLTMLEHALEMWPRVDAADRPEGIDRTLLLEVAADAACWAVEPARGLRLVEAGLDALRTSTDGERVASLLLERAMMRQQALHLGELDDLRAALRLCPGATRKRAEALGQTCRALALHGRVDEMRPLAQELATLAARLGEEDWTIEAHVATAISRPDDPATPDRLRQALSDALSIGSGRLEMIARVALADALDARGEPAAAAEVARQAWERVHPLGQARYGGASVAHLLARALIATGQWDDATDVIAEALELDPSPLGRVQLAQVEGLLAAGRGDASGIDRALRTLAAVDAPTQDSPRRALTQLQLSIELALLQGNSAGALQAARRIGSLRGQLPPHLLWPAIAVTWRACAESPKAATLPDLLIETADGLPQATPLAHACAATARAERQRASSWTSAVDAWQAMGHLPGSAYALMRQGASFLADGDRVAATTALRHAAQLAGRLDARPLAERIAAVAQRGRIDLGTPKGPTSPRATLTPRELEVLRLLVEGRSNREIAAELYIAVKTASVHVSNILAKLDVQSRGAAAAAARRMGFFDGD